METSSSRPLAMMPAESARAPDPLLSSFLQAEESEAAREALGALLQTHARPVLQAVTRRQLGGSAPVQEGQDVEDVVAGALLRLSEQLWSLREEGVAPIESFAGYVVTTAQNACHAFLRRRHPERARLRSRLRYLLTHDAELALWEGAAGALCGLAVWRGGQGSGEASKRLGEMRGRVTADAGDAGPRSHAKAFVRLVRDLLARAGGPCRVAEVAAILEDVQGVASGPPASSEGLRNDSGEVTVASTFPSPGEVVEQRDSLERLWAEIRLLPRHQRAALLLNLRDGAGRGMIGLLPLIGLATQAEIAGVLEVPLARLDAIWDELPVEDEWIARELGVTRRQVINFRKCARERLWRRTREADAT
jgi:hypothetical protein